MKKKLRKSRAVETFYDEDSPLMCARFGLLFILVGYHAASHVCSIERRLYSAFPQAISTPQGEGRCLESITDRAAKGTKFLGSKYLYRYGYRGNN